MIDIVNAYVDEGFSCTLITGRLVERNISLHSSVKRDRIIRYNRNNSIKRLFSWIYGFIQTWAKVVVKYRNADLFIVSNPPLAPLLPLFCSNKYSILIFDIYIETLSEYLPLRQFSPLSIIWTYCHKRVLSKADRIFTLTQGMKDTIGKYSKGKEVQVVTIWTDNSFLKPIPPCENHFIKANHLEEKFIVLYSGNISNTSSLEVILQVARSTYQDEIRFVIIGDGSGKSNLQRKAKELGLKNCIFLPWQDTSIFPFSLASANLAVVTLPERSSNMAIPSKVFNYMSVGTPILSISNRDSDLAKMVTDKDIGRNFEAQQINEIENFITEVFINKSKYEYYSAKSLSASTCYSKENVQDFIL